eukprot:1540857-Pyramimonas_sp.AAC.1
MHSGCDARCDDHGNAAESQGAASATPAVGAREGGQSVADVLDVLGLQFPGKAGAPAVEATDKDKDFAS